MKYTRHFSTDDFYKDDENATIAEKIGSQIEKEFGVDIEIYHDESASTGIFGIHEVIFYLSLGLGIFIGSFVKKLGEKAAEDFWTKIKECFNRICLSRRKYGEPGYGEAFIIITSYEEHEIKIVYELNYDKDKDGDLFFSNIKYIVNSAERLLKSELSKISDELIYVDLKVDQDIKEKFDLSIRNK